MLLVERAKEKGARVEEKALVQAYSYDKDHYQIQYNNKILLTKNIVLASGRLNKAKSFMPKYIGIKFHFQHRQADDALFMRGFKNGYFGHIPISSSQSNCAGLVKVNDIAYLKKLIMNYFKNERIDWNNIQFLEGAVPAFGLKQLLNQPNCYVIGDALAGLPPAIGSGFAHGIQSGILAAEYLIKNNPVEYHQRIKSILKLKMLVGKSMHYILMNPVFGNIVFPLLQENPRLVHTVLDKMHF